MCWVSLQGHCRSRTAQRQCCTMRCRVCRSKLQSLEKSGQKEWMRSRRKQVVMLAHSKGQDCRCNVTRSEMHQRCFLIPPFLCNGHRRRKRQRWLSCRAAMRAKIPKKPRKRRRERTRMKMPRRLRGSFVSLWWKAPPLYMNQSCRCVLCRCPVVTRRLTKRQRRRRKRKGRKLLPWRRQRESARMRRNRKERSCCHGGGREKAQG